MMLLSTWSTIGVSTPFISSLINWSFTSALSKKNIGNINKKRSAKSKKWNRLFLLNLNSGFVKNLTYRKNKGPNNKTMGSKIVYNWGTNKKKWVSYITQSKIIMARAIRKKPRKRLAVRFPVLMLKSANAVRMHCKAPKVLMTAKKFNVGSKGLFVN